jgi:hypothetical protein
MISSKQPLIAPGLDSRHVSKQLKHINSNSCWCEPIISIDENGREVVLHKEVTWN